MTMRSVPISELLQHSAWVERLARSLVRDPEAADELVQEAWLRAIKDPPRSTASARTRRAFLGSVMRNLIRQGAREERHRRAREEDHALDEALPDTADLVAAVDSQRAVVQELLGLPEAQRDTLLLRYFQDLSSAEIARRTGTPHATVRSHLKRGLDGLRARLDRKAGGDAQPQLMAILLAAPATTSKALVPAATAPLSVTALIMSKSHLALAFVALAVACGIAAVYQLDRTPSAVVSPGAADDGVGGRGRSDDLAAAQPDASTEEVQLARPEAPRGPGSARRTHESSSPASESATTASRAALVGRVVDPQGRPVFEASVWLGPAEAVDEDEMESVRRRGPRALDPTSVVDLAAAAKTDARGRFRVEAGERGEGLLWAKREDSRYGWVSVSSEDRGEEIEIVVEVLPREKRIAGVVQDAVGDPYPLASLTYSVVGEGGSAMSSGVLLDDRGRFEIEVLLQGDYDLVANDPFADPARPLRAFANRVQPGTLDLVLRLGEASILNVQVRDEDSNPIDSVSVTPMIGDETSSVSVGSYEGPHAGGLVELPLPGRPFYLQLYAPGYHDERIGPLDPAAIAGTIDVEMRRAPRVTGVVLAGGKPIAGARVRLFRPKAPGLQVLVDGYDMAYTPDGAATTTGADGAYELYHRHGGTYRVVAQHEDHAAADSGPVELGEDEDRSGVDLTLGTGGTLVVHAPPGTPEGETAVAYRGIGKPRTARVDSNGVATFHHIAEGRWCVRMEDDDLRRMRGSFQQSFDPSRADEELPWSCRVRAGETETVRLE
ncbi:MAG: sigma-70 family RNA polymerase sigma factor [Planctomycetota bacterium]